MDLKMQMKCKHRAEPAKEIIELNGKTAIMDVKRCIKCGEVSASPKEVDVVRKKLNPSFIEKLKKFFGLDKIMIEDASIFKGKVL